MRRSTANRSARRTAKRYILLSVVFVLGFLIFPSLAAGEETKTLSEIISLTGAELEWAPYRNEGRLLKGEKEVLFREGTDFFLVDYRKMVSAEPPSRSEDGEVYFSEEDGRFLLDFFGVKPALSKELNISTVIIDAGHGGKDPGAVGTHMDEGQAVIIKEKDLVLDVAGMLEDKLRSRYPDKRILLTRSDDRYLNLEERTEIANGVQLNEQEAMIFISLHANASFKSKSEGFEVWYLPPDYRRQLIDPESLDEEARGVAPILNTMLEEEYTVESVLLARNILSGLEKSLGKSTINRGLKEEKWFVVRNAKMPSVLVEIGFVTNEKEAFNLMEEDHLKKISEGIYNGVCDFIEHFQSSVD
ncbi:MAG: N-acetylmuramoyl-L-alanine amidase [Spirochaetia bacterium]